MDFKAALAAIKQLENGVDLVSAIETEVDRLNGKNYEVIGEKRTATSKLTAYESALLAIGKALGIEGDTEAILTSAEGKAKELTTNLTTAQTKLTETEGKLTTAESEAKTMKRQGKLSEVATKAGADPKVLERLLADKLEEMAIDGDTVKLGDKALKEFVEADESLKPFIPALFPQQKQQETKPTTPKLPNGSPNGQTPASDPIAAYQKNRYTGWKAAQGKS